MTMELVDKIPLNMVDLSSSWCKRLPEANCVDFFEIFWFPGSWGVLETKILQQNDAKTCICTEGSIRIPKVSDSNRAAHTHHGQRLPAAYHGCWSNTGCLFVPAKSYQTAINLWMFIPQRIVCFFKVLMQCHMKKKSLFKHFSENWPECQIRAFRGVPLWVWLVRHIKPPIDRDKQFSMRPILERLKRKYAESAFSHFRS